ncbi:hypothetical protein FRIGORI9N_100023 [Frigoribacterium sp. 9N]|nr:hypothetical protein FRIGORI9N_100023 [Frigoribacterium sp. 9N]
MRETIKVTARRPLALTGGQQPEHHEPDQQWVMTAINPSKQRHPGRLRLSGA